MPPHGPREPSGCGRLRSGGAVAFTLFFAGCSSFRPVRPLEPGTTALGVSLGGPLLNTLGTVFPTPILSVAGARGMQAAGALPWAVTGALDVTAGLYGNLHVEPGVVFHPIVHEGGWAPTLAVAGSLHVLANRHDALVAPHAAAAVSWRLGTAFVVYTGADAAMAIARPVRLIAGPLAGGEWLRGRWHHGLEVKWLAPYHDVEPAAPTWIAPFHHGYFTVLLATGYQFGDAR
jgi:hypothetical protein